MGRPRSIPLADLRTLVAEGGGTWRHTALCAALVRVFGCSERTARRAISQGLAAGVLNRDGGWYHAVDASPPPQLETRSHPSHNSARAAISISTSRPHRVDRRRMLELLKGRTYRYTDVIALLCNEFGCSQSTARGNLRHALSYGYLEHDPAGYRLSNEAIRLLASFGQLEGVKGVRFARFCAGRPGLQRD